MNPLLARPLISAGPLSALPINRSVSCRMMARLDGPFRLARIVSFAGSLWVCLATNALWGMPLTSHEDDQRSQDNESFEPSPNGTTAGDEAQIQSLVRRLGSNSYAEREEASAQLVQIGAEAVECLIQGVLSDDIEISWRSTDLLEAIAVRGNEQVLARVVEQFEQIAANGRSDLSKRSGRLKEIWQERRTQFAIAALRHHGATIERSSSRAQLAGDRGGGIVALEEMERLIVEVRGGADLEIEVIDGRVVAAAERTVGADPLDSDETPPAETQGSSSDSAREWLNQISPVTARMLEQKRARAEVQFADALAIMVEQRLPLAEPLAEQQTASNTPISDGRKPTAFAPLPVLPEDGLLPAARIEPAKAEIILGGEAPRVIRGDFEIAIAGGPIAIAGETGQVTTQHFANFGPTWSGNLDQFRFVHELPNLLRVAMANQSVSAEMLVELSMLDSMTTLTFNHCTFDTEAIKAFHSLRPNVSITVTGPAYMGINSNLTGDGSGCAITNVVENSAADIAGIKTGDVVVRIDDQPIADFFTLTLSVANRRIGEVMEIELLRDGVSLVRRLELGDRLKEGRR